jgi:pyruvate,water dikinase
MIQSPEPRRVDDIDTGDRASPPPVVVVLTTEPDMPRGLGGKGSALAELISAGYPVPATGVVSTSAYRRVADDPALVALVERIGGDEVVPGDEVDQVFAELTVDAELADEIAAMASTVGAGRPVAVRSSATVEDLGDSSFAGQYRTLLDVPSDDPAAVIDAVKRVWASLWHPAPTAYRRAFGIPESDAAMAVVVMQMIPATTAGVVFTADPGGSPGARVEAVEGLGESLVSGQRTPEAWVVEPDTESPADLPRPAARALELARSIEQVFGVPEDVEWAAEGDDVFVVQARPITVLEDSDGFDTPIDDHELTTGGVVEMVPGVLPALRWELNRFILDEAFRSVLDDLGLLRGSAVEERPFVRRVRGRAAIDFDQLRAAASIVPGAAAELERQYFGAPDQPTAVAPPRARPRRWLGLRIDFGELQRQARTLRTRWQVTEQADIVAAVVTGLRHRRPRLDDESDIELTRYARRLIDLAARGLTAELGVAAAAAATYGRLEQLLSRYLEPADAARTAQLVTSEVRLSAPRDPSSSAAVFAGPTWAERHRSPPSSGAGRGPTLARERQALEARLRALPGWTRRRILTGQVVDVRIHLIRRTIAEVIEQLERREQAKAAVLELGGEVRRVHLELGRRLVDRGVLDLATDIELLTTGEVVAAAEGLDPPGRQTIRRRRNWITRYEAEGALPIRFAGVPDREPTPLPEGDVLDGWGASPGRSRGRAQVLRTPDEPIDRGAVLVAQSTDASWSPLFVRAGAVVLERGGPLSHAAILARELGLPCVMNVEGATRVLDGKSVTVDGDNGLVVIETTEDRP